LIPKKVYSLYQLSKSISNLFRGLSDQSYWVKAEILKLNYYQQSGHAYPDLVDKQHNTLRAQFNGVIWKTSFKRITAKFKKIGEVLKDDMTIVAKVKINYHSVHGLSLNILDIDTDYTLGELAKQKQLSIKKLKEEKLFDLNTRTSLPLLPKTIAVISVDSSKGYSDFIDVLEKNSKGFQFHCKLFPATLQGDKAVTSIAAQLKIIEPYQNLFDAVAIVRGGGSEIGFSAYDNYNLAKSIAKCPIPVLTGIGHSTNLTVSELVSYKSFITPTKLAEFFVDQFLAVEQNLTDSVKSIEKFAVNEIKTTISHLHNLSSLFKINVINRLRQESALLLQQQSLLSRNVFQLFKNQTNNLEVFQQKLKLMDPKHTLKRGFSITTSNGKAVFSAEALKKGDSIVTQLYKGQIESTINKISKN